MSTFSLKVQSSLEVLRAKRKFSDNPGSNIFNFYNVLVQVFITTSKTKLNIWYNEVGMKIAS